jgi:hypothetical protein
VARPNDGSAQPPAAEPAPEVGDLDGNGVRDAADLALWLLGRSRVTSFDAAVQAPRAPVEPLAPAIDGADPADGSSTAPKASRAVKESRR